jgi:hypothetical protein
VRAARAMSMASDRAISLRCRVFRWHVWVLRNGDDGGPYEACSRCGVDRGPVGFGPMTTPRGPADDDERPSAPLAVARAGVGLAVRTLPDWHDRLRYRAEFLAELHDLPPAAQLRDTAGVLSQPLALRAALGSTPSRTEEDAMTLTGAATFNWRLALPDPAQAPLGAAQYRGKDQRQWRRRSRHRDRGRQLVAAMQLRRACGPPSAGPSGTALPAPSPSCRRASP